MAVPTAPLASQTADLVSMDWAAQHLTDPAIRIVEVDVDTKDLPRRTRAPRDRLGLEHATV